MLLANYLEQRKVDADLKEAILAMAKATVDLCTRVDSNSAVTVGDQNQSGDDQIQLDVLADCLFTEAFRSAEAIYAVASEEKGEIEIVNPEGRFIAAYDPLDGSSLVAANFSVGTIVGFYETKALIGATGKDLLAAAYSMYGPNTLMVIAVDGEVASFKLHQANFYLEKAGLKIDEAASIFAPGNLRAVNQNQKYKDLVDYWISNSYKLRYSGGMVPDIHHIIYKGQGVFAYPGYVDQPDGKLRLVYECLPMAKIVEMAGGTSDDGEGTLWTKRIEELHQHTQICVGSKMEVERFTKYLR